ncbi:MAG: hypothetical protein JWO86_6108 [Myxococcaceae bacterium]|nr:hypothetical protein [Myxococcaceae bacterium]
MGIPGSAKAFRVAVSVLFFGACGFLACGGDPSPVIPDVEGGTVEGGAVDGGNVEAGQPTATSCAPALSAPPNGDVSGTSGVPGDVRTYSCQTGYSLTGSATTTCQKNGAWSSDAPACAPNSCGAIPAAPSNGTVTAPAPGNGVTGDSVSYACNAGYTLTGSAKASCLASGSWSEAPTCTANSCASPPSAPTHGTVSTPMPGTGMTGDTVTYACDAGYVLSGAATAKCRVNGTWSAAPTCVAQPCSPALSAPAHGTVSATSGTSGDVRTYSCNTGYTLTGSATTTCQANHTWSNPAPTCVASSCGTVPSAPSHGTVTAPNPGAGVTGDSVSYTCNGGYTRTGPASATCQTSGSWSAAPSCTASSCGVAPSAPAHGAVTAPSPGSGVTGDSVTYTCNAGYTLSAGATATCQASGTWSAAPSCNADACTPALSAPAHGSVTSTTGVTGDTRTFSCSAGYTLTGSATTTCQASHAWSNPSPTCAASSCGAVPTAPAHGSVTAPTPGAGTTGDSVTYGCDAGYTLTGSATATCQTSGAWSAAPVCTVNSCGAVPAAPLNGTVTPPSPGAGVTGDSVTFAFNLNFTLTGSTTATCQTNGAWSASPTCITAPGAPQNLVLTPGAAKMGLTWSAPASNGGATVDSYIVDLDGVFNQQVLGTSASISSINTCNYPADTCSKTYSFTVRAHNAVGPSLGTSASARPKTSYVADNLPNIWSKSYGSGTCTGCHSGGPIPDLGLGVPAGYAQAVAEGARIYQCPVNDAACAGVMSGFNLFVVSSAEYRALVQWVADGSLQ